MIEEHRAALRHKGLASIQLIEGYAALGKQSFNMLSHSLIHSKFRGEYACKRMLGNVVLRRAQAACDYHYLGLCVGTLQRRLNLRSIVTNREFLGNGYARLVKVLGYAHRVGIDDLTYKDFIANCNDCSFYHGV